MRPTLLLALCLALALAAAPAARADDKAPPAVDVEAAGEIGRALLSPDDAVRRKAVARLLARPERGEARAAFLDAMSRASRAWADNRERLLELWLDQAVNGAPVVRARAVRILAGLGAEARRRLAKRLLPGRPLPDKSTAKGRAQPGEDAPPPEETEVASGTPRLYDVKDLFDFGMNAVDLRSLLLRVADAVEVKQFKTQFVVTAADAGHARLRNRLHDLRVTYRLAAKTKEEATATATDTPKTPKPTPTKAPPRRPLPQTPKDAGGLAADGARVSDGLVGLPASRPVPRPLLGPRAAKKAPPLAGRWRVEPLLFHVPRAALAGLTADRGRRDALPWARLLPGAFLRQETGEAGDDARGRNETWIETGDADTARVWAGALRRVPDARVGPSLEGSAVVTLAQAGHFFAGRRIRYSESVRATKGGAWRIVTGVLPHGIALDVTMKPAPEGATVQLIATRTEVGLPIPVVEMQPSPRAAPVELEQPEWSTTRTHARATIPAKGGGIFVSLGGLSTSEGERLVLVLILRPEG